MSHTERLSSFRGFSSIKLVRELDFHIVFCKEVIKITSLSGMSFVRGFTVLQNNRSVPSTSFIIIYVFKSAIFPVVQ